MSLYKRGGAIVLTVLLAATLLSPAPWARARAQGAADVTGQSKVQALFINVGKADAILLMLDDQRYLIDTGTKGSVEDMLRALSHFGVTKLDGVIITHTDKDHVGGLKALMESTITVARLYAGTFHNEKSLEKHPVYKQADKYGVPLTWLGNGDVIAVAQGIMLTTIGPLTHDEDKENNNSLVFRLETPQGDMMLTGDMEVKEETELLQAGLISSAAVLKVGHHGEGDASSDAFIYTVKPQIAVISTDSAVEKDTPDPKVMRRLWNIGAEVFVTQKATCGVLVQLDNGNAIGRLVDY